MDSLKSVQLGRPQLRLVFSPLAWLKLQFFCHHGETEIAGFGIAAEKDLLHVENFVTVRQRTSPMTVTLEDDAVAEYLDRCVDANLPPQRCLRIWCHTHPGSSAEPSGTDEITFARVFGSCDWAVMFILSRTGSTFARLSFHVGPRASFDLPVSVDWSAWPTVLADPAPPLEKLISEWRDEFRANIHRIPDLLPASTVVQDGAGALGSPWESFAPGWDWTDLDQELMEDYERYARLFESDT